MKRLVIIAAAALWLVPAATRADTVIMGKVCDNTCLGFFPQDDTPDYLGLFGPVFGNLMGKPFVLDISATGYALTINNHTISFGFNDPTRVINFDPNNPLVAGFAPGTGIFDAFGSNPFGFAIADQEYLCPEPIAPGVPEPSTWAMMLLGFAGVAWTFRRRRPMGRFTVRAL